MPDLFSNLNQLMIKYHFKPNRKLSQNFIIDENVVNKIIKEAKLSKDDIVLEIGSGTGALTKILLQKCKVVSVEQDHAFCELLLQELQADKFTSVEGSFLEVSLPNFNKIVAFPPYHISKEIMERLFSEKFDLALLCFQQEFVVKLLAFPGQAEHNAMSVLTQYFFHPEMVLGNISSSAFYPRPNTLSAIVKLVPVKRKVKAKNEKLFIQFIYNLFRFKNKDLCNALKKSSKFLKKIIKINEKKFNEKIHSLELGHEKVNLTEVEELVEIFNELF